MPQIFPENFIVFDCETTGLDPMLGDRIIEVGVQKVSRGKIVEEFSSFVLHDRPIPAEAAAIHGITDDLLRAEGRPAAEVFPVLALMFEDWPIVGHNVSFDLGFLNHHLKVLALPMVANTCFDTIGLAKQYLPPLSSYRLANVARFLEVSQPEAHRALADVDVTRQIFMALVKRASLKK